MKFCLIQIGKTKIDYLNEGVEEYKKRLKHFVKLEEYFLAPSKKKTKIEQKKEECESIDKLLNPRDSVVLLDENGMDLNSNKFASFLEKETNSSPTRLVFVIGGPYGFDESFLKKYTKKIRLSSMTFTHQMIRLFLHEQLYRGFSILKNLPYHHQ